MHIAVNKHFKTIVRILYLPQQCADELYLPFLCQSKPLLQNLVIYHVCLAKVIEHLNLNFLGRMM